VAQEDKKKNGIDNKNSMIGQSCLVVLKMLLAPFSY
jgi:hypothetical protein